MSFRYNPGVVSVLIPLYNHEKTVERTLNSLLNSNHQNIELVVSDDSSQDRSFCIANDWVKTNKNLFYNTIIIKQNKNLGITQNINFLISYATGEFVTILASDDQLPNRAIDIQKNYLVKNIEKDFVFSNIALIDSDGIIVREKIVSKRKAFFLKHQKCIMVDALYNWNLTWAKLFGRRESLLRFGPYPNYRAEDLWSALMTFKLGRFGFLDEVTLLFRIKNFGTATGGYDPDILWKDMQMLQISFSKTTPGFLGLILKTRALSFRVGDKRFLSRLPWLVLRKMIEKLHCYIIGT